MLGFADIADDAMLSGHEIARRCGFTRKSSLLRALDRMDAGMPPSLFRNRYRGEIVKAWFASLPMEGGDIAPGDGLSPSQPKPGAIDFQAAKRRILARISAA